MKKLMVLISIFLCNSALSNQLPSVQAPFGLAWGANKTDIIKNGTSLDGCVYYEDAISCHTVNPPLPLEITTGYTLTFSYTSGLIKISAYTAPIEAIQERANSQYFYNEYTSLMTSLYQESYISTHEVTSLNSNYNFLKFNFENPLSKYDSANLNAVNTGFPPTL